MKVFTVRYDCPDVGEHWSIDDKYFTTKEDAEQYTRENLVNEKTGIAYFYEDFTIEERELTAVEKEYEKLNTYFKTQKNYTSKPLKGNLTMQENKK